MRREERACPYCDPLWIWLWPAIFAPVILVLMILCAWLAGRWRALPSDGRDAHDVLQALYTVDTEPSQDTDDGPGAGSSAALGEQMDSISRKLQRYQRELHAMRDRPEPPVEVRRIEVPVQRIVEIPEVQVVEKPVTVEKVVQVEVPKKVEKEVLREVKKEVVKDKLVQDPATQRALRWAKQDLELLKSELAAKHSELQDAKEHLQRLEAQRGGVSPSGSAFRFGAPDASSSVLREAPTWHSHSAAPAPGAAASPAPQD